MDLSTLDPSNPQNIELARLGAGRIRDVADATITSFGVEHSLAGPHKFLVDATASRPAAGNPGRLFINTERGCIERDTGAIWHVCRTTPPGRNTAANAVLLTGSYQSLINVNANVPFGSFIHVEVTVTFIVAAGTAGAELKLQIGGVDYGFVWNPGWTTFNGQSYIFHMSDLITTGVVEGAQLIDLQARATTGSLTAGNRNMITRGV